MNLKKAPSPNGRLPEAPSSVSPSDNLAGPESTRVGRAFSRTLFTVNFARSHTSESPCFRRTPSQQPFPSLCLFMVISCTLVCLLAASQSSSSPVKESTRQHHLMRQLRHRMHSPHNGHSQHKRHHYYQQAHSRQQFSTENPTTTTTNSSPTRASHGEDSLPPIYLLQQSWSRHRHPYYYFYAHDNSTSELIHRHNQTLRRYSSRQGTGRQVKERTTKVIYQLKGIQSDNQLPICESWQVCNKVDTYSTPWVEKQCRCAADAKLCSESLSAEDGHSIVEKAKQYKTCEPVRKLPTCRYFRDITWTLTTTTAKSEHSLNSLLAGSAPLHGNHHESENVTRQEMKCICPHNSVAYVFKHHYFTSPDGNIGYRYHFACSPETKLRCKRKEPCRLFTARKRSKVEEVTLNTLCQCAGGHSCPANHRHPSVLIGSSHPLEHFRTYSGYCYLNYSKSTEEEESEDALSEHETYPAMSQSEASEGEERLESKTR